jgi:hypothetical protein
LYQIQGRVELIGRQTEFSLGGEQLVGEPTKDGADFLLQFLG